MVHRAKSTGPSGAPLSRLLPSPAKVPLSGYPLPLYASLPSGWHTVEFQAMSRGGVRTEKPWMNDEPCAVHWAGYAGRDFTDRQRIKRKAARWSANYRALPPGERPAVLTALLETEARGPAWPCVSASSSWTWAAVAGAVVVSVRPLFERWRPGMVDDDEAGDGRAEAS